MRFGGTTNVLEIYTGSDAVINVRSINTLGQHQGMRRCQAKTLMILVILDVKTIKATSYQNLTLTDFPIVTIKGGTGLTQLGQPEQLLELITGNSLEYFTDNPATLVTLLALV